MIRSLLSSPLIDRVPERRALQALADSGGPALGLLYGRRRVGKTYLLSRVWGKRRVFYYLAAETTPELNRTEMVRELFAWLAEAKRKEAVSAEDFPSWRTVFRYMVQLARDEPLVVVLDEFQYLIGGEDDVESQLAAVWDKEADGVPLTIILSGSQVSIMQHLAGGGRPLYGRFTWSQRLKPFDYSDAALMMHGRPAQDCALLYGTFGGTPRYLAAIRSQETPAETIKRTMLSPNGEVQLQLQMLIEQEQGIRDTGDYRAVLAAVAQGCTELNDIAMRAGLQSRPYVVRRILHVLGELELIYKERNFGAASKTPYRYRIADPAVRFWYTFVYANRLALETGNVDSVWRSNVAPRLTTYMGLVYERIVAQAYRRYSQTWKMPAAHEWSRWEGTVRSKRSIEIDLVAQLEDGRILSGEIKSRSAPMSVKSHYQLMHHLEDIANSGHRWAHDALSENQSAGYLYFSVSGFEANFRQLAKSDSRIHLLGLEDLYPSMG